MQDIVGDHRSLTLVEQSLHGDHRSALPVITVQDIAGDHRSLTLVEHPCIAGDHRAGHCR
jgi:hypothetical protein